MSTVRTYQALRTVRKTRKSTEAQEAKDSHSETKSKVTRILDQIDRIFKFLWEMLYTLVLHHCIIELLSLVVLLITDVDQFRSPSLILVLHSFFHQFLSSFQHSYL